MHIGATQILHSTPEIPAGSSYDLDTSLMPILLLIVATYDIWLNEVIKVTENVVYFILYLQCLYCPNSLLVIPYFTIIMLLQLQPRVIIALFYPMQVSTIRKPHDQSLPLVHLN